MLPDVAHLSLLLERLDGQAVRADVHDGSQLEPFCWVGRPHRLPILHRSALTALEQTHLPSAVSNTWGSTNATTTGSSLRGKGREGAEWKSDVRIAKG